MSTGIANGARKKNVWPTNAWVMDQLGSNHARRNRKEETKKERSPVTHKDGRRVEIMRKESNVTCSDDCDERPQVGLAQEPKIRQFECVQKNAPALIATIPAANPSRPSIKLIA